VLTNWHVHTSWLQEKRKRLGMDGELDGDEEAGTGEGDAEDGAGSDDDEGHAGVGPSKRQKQVSS